MTKAELRDHLKAGYFMDDAFDFSPGQDCDILRRISSRPEMKSYISRTCI